MSVRLLVGDTRQILPTLPDASVQCVVTSPPYFGLRDYGVAGQIGLEPTPAEYVEQMVAVFRAVRRVLRDDGTVWLNLGDSYAAGGNGIGTGKQLTNVGSWMPPKKAPPGYKSKDLLGIPWRVAFALQADGWWLRSDIIWAKPNPMPESVTDRPTSAHEHVFLLAKRERYFYDAEAVKEPSLPASTERQRQGFNGADRDNHYREGYFKREGYENTTRNIRNVWNIATQAYPETHFATFPTELAERCIKAGTSERGCCATCRAPLVRQTETQYRRHEKWFGDKQGARHSRGKAGTAYDEPIATQTTGWAPACACNATTTPCTVLDPFGGAGTTGLVADRLGRDALLIELNPAYAKLAENRIRDDMPLFADVA